MVRYKTSVAEQFVLNMLPSKYFKHITYLLLIQRFFHSSLQRSYFYMHWKLNFFQLAFGKWVNWTNRIYFCNSNFCVCPRVCPHVSIAIVRNTQAVLEHSFIRMLLSLCGEPLFFSIQHIFDAKNTLIVLKVSLRNYLFLNIKKH